MREKLSGEPWKPLLYDDDTTIPLRIRDEIQAVQGGNEARFGSADRRQKERKRRQGLMRIISDTIKAAEDNKKNYIS